MTSVGGWHPPSVAWRITSIALVVGLAAVYSVASISDLVTNRILGTQLNQVTEVFPADETRPPETVGSAASAQNLLLLGSDSWNAVNGTLENVSGQRSDTIMVLHIPADRKNIYVMSILRDSWIILPGREPEKVNAALSFGGVPLAVQSVESLIGTRIDHVALVDYAGFAGLADAVGGIDIDNPTAFSSTATGHYYPAGAQHLDGTETLAFAREWAALPDGDFERVRNQQLVMKAVLGKAMTRETLVDPVRIAALLGAVKEYVAVDDGLDLPYLTGLARELRGIRAHDFTFFTAPTTGIGTSADGQSIVNLDWDKLAEVQRAFQTDTLDGYQPVFQTMQ
ncbi:LCP family protein required for cell wall assembly [Cryobacterium sp. MP_M5]|uniref:LCP family protein n=1 Tax=unclassified Cryobacterium TaxID=2649013 RepID=UPI0018CBC36C|nr:MULTISPECIES: LCP family protein [unclassified Cryobacterium]MBG6058645.1 LCP family protein required for cell wall assembly [Cryobacterium sp. MP_M3]MEC5177283.1 LCP family protein required for cell wall assembly [Cryobacterium sp. MP_M5]